MAVEIIFPRVDMGMTEGRVGRWLVEEGAIVAAGDPLFEIETDKAAMEIDAPASGTLRGIRAAAGEEVAVGTALAWIVADGEPWQAETPPAPASPPPPPSRMGANEALLRATPLARREARRLEIDLRALSGSGPRGRIVLGDVLSAPPQEAGEPVSGRLYRQWLGLEAGTPLVFLHGFGSDQTSWRAVWNGLEAGHRILAIDLPGHGRSEAVGPANFEALVDSVQAVLGEEGVSRLHLVGHSLGGAIALALADAGISELRSLTLIAPAGLGPEIDGDFLAGFVRATQEASLAPWLRRLFADPTLATQAFVRAILRGRDPAQASHQRALLQAIFPDGTQAVSLSQVLPRLAVPTQVIWGMHDAIIPIRHAAALPALVGLHRLPCGHVPQIEEPRTVSLLIERLARR